MEATTHISVKLGKTISDGDYGGIRIDIGVNDHVREDRDGTGKAGVSAAIDRVYAIVEKKLAEKLSEFE